MPILCYPFCRIECSDEDTYNNWWCNDEYAGIRSHLSRFSLQIQCDIAFFTVSLSVHSSLDCSVPAILEPNHWNKLHFLFGVEAGYYTYSITDDAIFTANSFLLDSTPYSSECKERPGLSRLPSLTVLSQLSQDGLAASRRNGMRPALTARVWGACECLSAQTHHMGDVYTRVNGQQLHMFPSYTVTKFQENLCRFIWGIADGMEQKNE
jgi:hypothetical protein